MTQVGTHRFFRGLAWGTIVGATLAACLALAGRSHAAENLFYGNIHDPNSTFIGAITDADGNVIGFQVPPPEGMTINGSDGKPMVTIDLKTGAVEFGPTYSLSETAKIFWLSMGRQMACAH